MPYYHVTVEFSGVFAVGIDPIGQQREMKFALRPRQIVYLEPADLLFDVLRQLLV